MPNAWLDALKKWNSGKDMWCMPKRGTPEHAEVVALMEKKKPKTAAPKEVGASRAEIDSLKAILKSRMEEHKAKQAASSAPKLKRTIKVSKKVFEPAAPAAKEEKGMTGEERMKIVSQALKQQDKELEEKERKRKSMAARKAIEKRVKDRLRNA